MLLGESAPAPAAGVSASCEPGSLSRRYTVLARGLGEELLNIAVCPRLINKGVTPLLSLVSLLLPLD